MKKNFVNNAGWEELDITGTSPDAADFERTVDSTREKPVKSKKPEADETDMLDEDLSDFEDFDTSGTESDEITGDEADAKEDDTAAEAPEADVATGDEAEDADKAVAPDAKTPKLPRHEKRIKHLINMLKAKDEEKAEAVYKEAQARLQLEAELAEYRAAFATTYATSSEAKIKAAEAKLRKAKNEVDVEAEIEATRELQEALVEKRTAENLKSAVPEKKETPKALSQRDFVGQEKTRAWIRSNPEIMGSMELRSAVERVAQAVAAEGFEPHDDRYYMEVNKRVNSTFKEYGVPVKAKLAYFDDDEDTAVAEEAPPPPAKKAPVAEKPATKSPLALGPRQPPAKKGGATMAKASAEEVAFAKRLGINPQDYLKNAMLEQKTNKFGYSPVFIPKKKK